VTPLRRALLAAGVPALGAATLLLYATTAGVGVTPDSVIYLDAARHLAAGDGYVAVRMGMAAPQPLIHYPPLYPFALSTAARAGVAPLDAARWFNVFLFAGNVVLIGALIFRTCASVPAVFLGAFLAALSVPFIESHSAVWSEPLFLFCFLLGIWLVALGRSGAVWVALGSVAIGFAWLTRYAAGALLPGFIVGRFLTARGVLRRRAAEAALIAVLASLPIGLWSLRNIALIGAPADRGYRFRLLSGNDVITFFRVASSWLFPGSERIALVPLQDGAIALALAVVAAALVYVRLHSQPASMEHTARKATAWLLFACGCAYFIMLLVSKLFFDHSTPFDQRILSPVFAVALVIVAAYLTSVWRSGGHAVHVVLGAFLVYAAVGYTAVAWVTVRYLHENGRGFNAKSWRYDRIFTRLAESDDGLWIYSNHPAAVFYLTGRQASQVPVPGVRLGGQNPWGLSKSVDGPVLIVLFEDARKFAPRDESARNPIRIEAEILRLIELRGGVVLERERNAVLYRVESFP
jgi:hypothetical protein